MRVLTGSVDLHQLLVASAGLHDLGKATPVFQGQLFSPRAAEFEDHVSALRAAGFAVDDPGPVSPGEQKLLARHEVASALAITARLAAEEAVAAALLVPVSSVVAGHHGRWPQLDDQIAYDYELTVGTRSPPSPTDAGRPQ